MFLSSLNTKITMVKIGLLFRNIFDLFKRQAYLLYIISFVLVNLPPFTFLGINDYISTHNIAFLLVIVLFFLKYIATYTNKINKNVSNLLLILIISYLLGQSLSVLAIVNIFDYARKYKNILFGIMFFLISVEINNKKKVLDKTIYFLILIVIVKIAFQAVFYFQIQPLWKWTNSFLEANYANFISLQFKRQRFFIEIYDIALVPIIYMFLIYQKKIITRLVAWLSIIGTIFFAFVSNYRIHLVVGFFDYLAITNTLILKNNKKKLLLISVFLLITLTSSLLSKEASGISSANRIIAPDSVDIKNIIGRFHYWHSAVKMGLSSPFFGIGLGQFYDYFDHKSIVQLSLKDSKNLLMRVTAIDPHNIFFGIFAETGLSGFITYLIMLLYFISSDYLLLKQNNLYLKSMIASFWALFLFSLVGPSYDLTYQSLIWFLRASIISSSKFTKPGVKILTN